MPIEDADRGFLARWSRRKAQARQGVLPPEAGPDQAAPQPSSPATLSSVTDAAAVTAKVAAAPVDVPVTARADGPADAAAFASAQTPAAAPTPPPPTLADVAQLTRESDFTRFVAPGVDGEVRNAALKKLFTDPRFNVMDGLDTYIDDYGKPDPLPEGMLRQMTQSKLLGLFSDEDDAAATAVAAGAKSTPTHVATPAAPGAASTAVTPAAPGAHPFETDTASDEDPDLRLQPHAAAGPAGADPGARGDTGRQR